MMRSNRRTLVVCLLMTLIFTAATVAGGMGMSFQDDAAKAVLGTWDMATEFQGQQMPAVMTISMEDGELAGVWASQDMEMTMMNIVVDGNKLSFSRTMGDGGMEMNFDGTVDGDTISGKWITGMGELPCSGKRRE